MSLNTNLKKIFEEYITDELKIEIVKPGTSTGSQDFESQQNFP